MKTIYHILLLRVGNARSRMTMVGLACLLLCAQAKAVATPGTGSVGMGLAASGGGCSTCSVGSQSFEDPTAKFSIEMGQTLLGGSAGEFYFSQIKPGAQMATPALLDFTGITDPANGVQVIKNSDGTISQIVAPQVFATVTVNSSYSYQINFYSPQAVGSWNGSGYTVVNGPANLITTWTIVNPDASPSAFNRLQITEVPSGGVSRSWLYTYNSANGVWTLQLADNSLEFVSQITDVNGNLNETLQMANQDGTMVYAHFQVYTNFSWGQGILTDTVGIGVDARTNRYAYYGVGSVPYAPYESRPPIQSIVYADGQWEYYLKYDSQGRATNVLSGYDGALSSDPNTCYSTVYSYTPVYPGDDGSIQPDTPRAIMQLFKGSVISSSYRVFKPGIQQSIQCLAPLAGYNDPNNLVTTTTYYPTGDFTGRMKSVTYPDGTMSFYGYTATASGEIDCVTNGQPDSTHSYIIDGTQTATTIGNVGQILSVQSQDVASGITLSSDTYSDFDAYQRYQTVTHLDGTSEHATYACCGLESTTDRDGVQTQYTYDILKRQVASTTLGITTSNVLDAAGNVLQTIRIGTNNLQIIQHKAAYNTADFMTVETNALGGVTTYSRTNDVATGELIQMIVHPDGGTLTNYYFNNGSLKETIGTATHGARYVYGAGTDANGHACTFLQEIKVKTDGSDSSETTTTYSDMAGRSTEVLYADGHYSQSFYNVLGQLYKQIDPDGVTNFYQYNGKGEQAYMATAMSPNETGINFSGNDRITWTTNDVTFDNGVNVKRARTYVWTQNGVNSPTLISTVETSVEGLTNWQTIYRDVNTPVTTTNVTVYSSPSRTMFVLAPDGSYAINIYSYGRLLSSTRYSSDGITQISGTSYTYDAYGRQYQVTDARNSATTYGYNNADLVTSVTTPNPGTFGGAPETTLTTYNTMSQPYSVTQPDGTTVNSIYLRTGELGLQSGSRTYPVGYSYDYAGRMQTMTNWSSYPSSGTRVTTWYYDPYRGWLASKTYADGHGPSYAYTPAGRLQVRNWVRGVTTTYNYDMSGSLTNISYSDSTPSVTNTYNRMNRLSIVAWSNITDTLTYNLANELLGESYSGGILNGLAVTNGYDADLRRTTLAGMSGGTQLLSASYGYDAASRLSTVSDGNNNSATYSYVANSPLVSQIKYKKNSTTRMTTTRQYDYVNRLISISSSPSSLSPIAFTYQYNKANQRTRARLADGSYWLYRYDALGQVISGCKYWADGTPVAGQQFGYAFDNIGNRTQTQSGGDQHGGFLRTANYSANNLNQIISRGVPGYVDIKGVSFATNTVTVNGQTAYRKVEYFRDELAVNNGSSAVWQGITVSATGQSSVSGNQYVPQTPEQFSYDADGNLTNDGRWAYTWDGENRLVKMTVNTNVGPQYTLDFVYDPQGHRIQKTAVTNGITIYTDNFLYDGWNLVAILNPQSSLLQSFIWGSDLSGSMQGAGGVGGLLEVSYYGSATTNCFPAFDGNGNVATLINTADGTVIANYDYGPFGEVIRSTGPMAKVNPFRFSTKYQDNESDLVYYSYRYYNPSTGRWPNRDPIESGNPYAFARNNPLSIYDVLGLWNSDVHMDRTKQWASQLGIDSTQSQNIGVADNGIDSQYDPSTISDATWSWHFNRSTGGDSRLTHRDEEVRKAKAQCTKTTDNPYNAAAYLGRALHPLQDWVAHGDFNRRQEAPSLTTWGPTRIFYWHNYFGPDGAGAPDNVNLDSDGPDGRATIDHMHLGWTFSDGDRVYWANFHGGSQRINKTESLTKDLLGDFQSYVRANGKPCGECWKAFLGGK